MIDISFLTVTAEKKEILRGLNLQIKSGEIHALMGPNGSGKSTLANVVAGSPDYQIRSGKVVLKGSFGNLGKPAFAKATAGKSGKEEKSGVMKGMIAASSRQGGIPRNDVTKMSADERARAGIFLSFQNPPVITGVEVGSFLRQIYLGLRVNKGDNKGTSKGKKEKIEVLGLGDFRIHVLGLMKRLGLKSEIYNSTLNETMSGGEKKKLEILQMILLSPRLIILDEIDSGLDVDALKIIASEINRYAKENPDASFLIISHYNRIFSYICPDFVHIMKNGRVVKSGGRELVESIEQVGYAKF